MHIKAGWLGTPHTLCCPPSGDANGVRVPWAAHYTLSSINQSSDGTGARAGEVPIIKAVKSAGHKGLQKATSSLHGKINLIPELSGEGVKRRRGRPKKGSGLLGDVLGMINPTIGVVAKTVGLGVKKTRKPRTRKGKGIVSDLAKSGLKALAPVLIDAASNAAKNKISGMGAKKKRTTKKTTKRRRPRKTRTGAALMPAGY